MLQLLGLRFLSELCYINKSMITKQDSLRLQKDFKKVFATKQDIAKLKKVFATKDDLKRFSDAFSVVYVTKLEFNEKFDDFKMEIKDAFLTSQDRILGEIKAMREEMASRFSGLHLA